MSTSAVSKQPPRQSGNGLWPARDCWYPPAVQPSDLLRVDFDICSVDADGLYLVEEVCGEQVVWRGCRRYRFEPHTREVQVDTHGNGTWVSSRACASWRIAGRVLEVYRPVGPR